MSWKKIRRNTQFMLSKKRRLSRTSKTPIRKRLQRIESLETLM